MYLKRLLYGNCVIIIINNIKYINKNINLNIKSKINKNVYLSEQY